MSDSAEDRRERSRAIRREHVAASPRFSGGRFHNTGTSTPVKRDRSILSTTSEFFLGSPGVARRPPIVLPVERPLEAWARRAETGLRVTWLGHSTTLIEIDGFRVLTDPVWSERISPVSFAGPKRFHPTPVAIAELPSLEAIIVSHDHFDHFDAPALRMLSQLGWGSSNKPPTFYTSLGVGERLEALGIDPARIVELDWWETALLADGALSIGATPAYHFSGRSLFDRNRTLWSSWVIASDKRRVFFSGDTGLTSDFADIRDKRGPFDLIMLEVGAFHPAWGDIHLGPENALLAHQMLGGGPFLPVHWGTFDLALHAWDDPIETLVKRASGTHLLTPPLGRAVEPRQVDRIETWWRLAEKAAPRLGARVAV